MKAEDKTIDPDTSDVILPFDRGGESRRTFLKMVGFGLASATMASCSRGPVRKVVTWAQAPEGMVAGRGYTVATTCAGCTAGCGVLARCRDGRPVKLEGNPLHPVNRGGLCAVGQAEILSLYDSHRFDGPRKQGRSVSWKVADQELSTALGEIRKRGGRVRLLTETVTSPSTLASIQRFLSGFKDARHVVYDPLSASAILDAHESVFGARILPHYRFERADVVAAFEADFLATWISPVEFAAGYASRRDPEGGRMSRHWHFESRMSLSGGAADERFRVAPWELGAVINALVESLRGLAGRPGAAEAPTTGTPHAEAIAALARELWEARGRSLVVCGANDTALQTLVAQANELLGNHGKTVDLARPSRQKQGSERALEELLQELEAGKVDALLVRGVNPLYDLPEQERVAAAFKQAGLLISFASLRDETSEAAHWICPEPHALECWGDAEPLEGVFSLRQPAVPPLRAARTLRETLSRWMGDGRGDRELLREHWKSIHASAAGRGASSFGRFFHDVLRDGVFVREDAAARLPVFRPRGVKSFAPRPEPPAGTMALVLYPKVSMRDGRHAQNPWLQELPDPVSRICWESYAVLSPKAAVELGIEEGDHVRIAAGDGHPEMELPVHLQPGQHDRVVAVALGYGRLGTDRFAGIGPDWWEGERTVEPGGRIGINAAPFLTVNGGNLRYEGPSVKLTATGRATELASVQEYHSLEVPKHLAPEHGEVREAVRTTDLKTWVHDPDHAFSGGHGHHAAAELWPPDHEYKGHHWGLVIDLNACIGCGACVIGCQAENNVPVVGRDEVRRHREMAWIRIDRYAQGDGDDVQVATQPMMCQHCDHAPCESVCPVLATVHSEEGLNQQVYNRCVGTRYCANTCPYKVRRFNWFEYAHEDQLQNLSLNPDVTVRSRGVMEKCTMCMQRIQEARFEAKRAGRPMADGAVQVACQQSCPTKAITFGDTNDAKSAVSRLARSKRAYRVLEELNVRPSVAYLAQVKNPRA